MRRLVRSFGAHVLTFDAAAAVGGSGARSEADHHRRQHGALAAAVLTLDKVDALVQLERQVLVAHEVLEGDVAQQARRRRLAGRGRRSEQGNDTKRGFMRTG